MSGYEDSDNVEAIEVVVIGAGPAGTTSARLLARWGHTVVVLSPSLARRGFGESIPPSGRRLFEALDLLPAVDAASFYRSTGNTVWWADERPRVEQFSRDQLGYQVYRPAFDDLLTREAEADGVVFRRGAIVRSVAFGGADPPTLNYSFDGGTNSIAARVVLDCSGRVGVIARQGFRQPEAAHATLALVASWKRPADGWALPDPTHTLIEAYRNGWAWSVPVSAEERYVTVMVDRHEDDVRRRSGLALAYQGELAKTRELGPRITRGSLSTAPWSADASLYSSSQYAGPGFLLVGDAASFIDPLSSFGVKKAMASAWLAAVAAHTSLVNSSMATAAFEFYGAREREVYASYLRQSTTFFSDGAARYADAFWVDRSEANETNGSDVSDGRILKDPRVAEAWRELRRSASIALERSPTLTVVHVPAVKGREVVLEPALTGPGVPEPLRFVRGVDVVAIANLILDAPDVPELFERYMRESGTAALPDFLTALSVLLGTGLITNRTLLLPTEPPPT